MLSGKLFHNGIIMLEKLNVRKLCVYRNEYATAAMQIYDFLCYTVFLYIYLRCVQFQGACQAACRHCVQ